MPDYYDKGYNHVYYCADYDHVPDYYDKGYDNLDHVPDNDHFDYNYAAYYYDHAFRNMRQLEGLQV
jgi:hypothetical protein